MTPLRAEVETGLAGSCIVHMAGSSAQRIFGVAMAFYF
jgi:hypothetical protein